jgi:hypothetical protein
MAGIVAVLLAFGAFIIGTESEAPAVLRATIRALAAVAYVIEHDLRDRLLQATIDAQSPWCCSHLDRSDLLEAPRDLSAADRCGRSTPSRRVILAQISHRNSCIGALNRR